jgi:hypothetical protein
LGLSYLKKEKNIFYFPPLILYILFRSFQNSIFRVYLLVRMREAIYSSRVTRRRVCACGCRAEFIADERLAPLEIKWNQRRFIHSFGQHQRKEKKKIEKKSPSKRNDDLVDFWNVGS